MTLRGTKRRRMLNQEPKRKKEKDLIQLGSPSALKACQIVLEQDAGRDSSSVRSGEVSETGNMSEARSNEDYLPKPNGLLPIFRPSPNESRARIPSNSRNSVEKRSALPSDRELSEALNVNQHEVQKMSMPVSTSKLAYK